MAKILVIDDDAMVRDTIVRVLKTHGHEVSSAGDGLRGFEIFLREWPDLVVVDVIMPVKEGIETIIEMHRERPDAKIIAISGGGRGNAMDFLDIARKFGACDVIAKPFNARDLMAHVDGSLEGV